MPRIGPVGAVIAAGAATIAAFAGGGPASVAATSPRPTAAVKEAAAPAGCQLRSPTNRVQHVIQVQFDNTHLRRDFPNVLSDLEQMPTLRNFLRRQGTLLDDDHTILIAHTAGGILSTLTGLYPDRNGQTVSNSYDWFRPDGTPAFTSSFKYWTDPVDPASPSTDPLPNMVNGDSGTAQTTPAPWVPFTRAGCDVGEVSMANTVLENTSTAPNGDITEVFGENSPEFVEASSSDPATRAKAQTDFVGIAVHCAQTSTLCSSSPNARPDLLPDEPGGYAGFDGLFGARYVNPAIAGAPVVDDLDGNPIADPAGNPGFPGFDAMSASVSLGYVAKMQEAGIPITYAYISDAHDNHHDASGRNVAFGPGEAGYVAQLHAYDRAFGTFFARLAQDGITPANTLFVFTVDEGDHFAGMPPKGCDGATTPCTYTHANWAPGQPLPANQIGEVNATIGSLLPAGEPKFDIHFDSAPSFYVNGQPARTDATLRQLERDVAAARTIDPYESTTSPTAVAQYLVDTQGEQALHMVNADPQRTPSFTMFANPDFFLQTTPTACGAPTCVDFHFAWNHGDAQPEIATTWVGLVGPGVRAGRSGRSPFTDHTDWRPTVLDLVGLHDSYASDGRIVTEALEPAAVPAGLRRSPVLAAALGAALKQLDAPFGAFGHDVLVASTRALRSGSASDDATYTALEGRIGDLTTRRDALVTQIRAVLATATTSGRPIDPATAARLLVETARLLHDAG
jgi:hypothetical protein